MASLKRYRQTTDGNVGARFRDIPPRFKRQKSVPSPESNTGDKNKQNKNNKSTKSPQQDFHTLSDLNGTNDTLHGNREESKESESSKDKKVIKKGKVSRPHLTVDQSHLRSTQPIVLSPMDSNLFNLTRNDGHELSSININPFSWENQQQVIWPHITHNNEEYNGISDSDANTLPISGSWIPQSNSNVHHTANTYPEHSVDPPKDYSETDQRIIEMFKELERVADQKEKEENENGTDRKSLVSHHLRMLMCAIDKYTEGIEDEIDSEHDLDDAAENESSHSSGQEVEISLPTKCNLESPPSIRLSQTQTDLNAKGQNPVHYNSAYQQFPIAGLTSQSRPCEFTSKSKFNQKSWNLWSSPSFNMLDIYNVPKGHNSSETADSSFVLFDQLGMENDYSPRAEEYLTRTPLYQR